MRAVDLTLSIGILGGEISRNLFGAPSNRALVYQQVTGKWVVQRLRGILEKQSLGITRTVEGKRFWEEGNSNMYKTVSRVRSGKSNADAMANDKRWRAVHACFTESCDQLQGSPCVPYSLMTSRLYFVSCSPTTPTSPVHTKISTNTPTNPPTRVIKRTGMLEYKRWYTSIDAYTTKTSSEYKRSGTSVVTNTCT